MMNYQCFKNLIIEADQFGAVFKPTIKFKATKYKTIQGGIISIVIYGLSFAYFIYGIQLWATNQILPNITEYKEVADIVEYNSTNTILSFTPFLFPGQIDPFNSSNIILMAASYRIQDGIANSNIKRLRLSNGWISVDSLDLRLDNRNESWPKITESQIFLIQCVPALLDIGEQCAQEAMIKNFWAQTNVMKYRLHQQQYNFQTRSLQQITKQQFVLYRQDSSVLNYLQLQKSYSYADEGFLFPNIKQYDYISDISQQLQGLTIEQGVALYRLNIFLCFNIRMDIVFQVQNIAFPNISSVLAKLDPLFHYCYFSHTLQQQQTKKDQRMKPNSKLLRCFIQNSKIQQFKKIGAVQQNQFKINSLINSISFRNLFNITKNYVISQSRNYACQTQFMKYQDYNLPSSNFSQRMISISLEINTYKYNFNHKKLKRKIQQKQNNLVSAKLQINLYRQQPSIERDSRIVEIYDLKEDDLKQSLQIRNNAKQDIQNNQSDSEDMEDYFYQFCQFNVQDKHK